MARLLAAYLVVYIELGYPTTDSIPERPFEKSPSTPSPFSHSGEKGRKTGFPLAPLGERGGAQRRGEGFSNGF